MRRRLHARGQTLRGVTGPRWAPMKTLFSVAVLALSLVCLMASTAVALVDPEPVITSARDTWDPHANETWLAFTSARDFDASNQYTAQAWNFGTGQTVNVNASGTDGWVGSFDPGTNTLLYQQADGRRSDLYVFNLDTASRGRVTDVNSKLWEWDPLMSSTFISFFRNRNVNGRWRTSMYLYRRATGALRELWTVDRARVRGTFNESLGERYVGYTLCRRTCQAYVYDATERDTRRVPSDGKSQWSPLVDETNGTVYVTRSGDRCGVNANVYRFPLALDGAPEKIIDFPDGISPNWSSLSTDPETGQVDLWMDRWICGTRDVHGADIYVARGVDGSTVEEVTQAAQRYALDAGRTAPAREGPLRVWAELDRLSGLRG